MLIPSGKLVKIIPPQDLGKFLRRKKIKNGFLRGVFVNNFGRFKAIIVFRGAYPVLAELVELNTGKVWRGESAVKNFKAVLNDVLRNPAFTHSEGGLNNVEIYELKKKEVDFTVKMNGDYVIRGEQTFEDVGGGVKEDSRTLARYERIVNLLGGGSEGGGEKRVLEDYLRELSGEFTGIVYGYSEDYYAEVYVVRGRVEGARVRVGDKEFRGDSALYYLDRECEVRSRVFLSLSVPESCRVVSDEGVLDRVEIIVDERLENLIEQIKSVRIKSRKT